MERIESNHITPDIAVSYRERKKRFVHNIWKSFTTNSTVHGFHFIFEKRPALQRLLWFLLLVSMLCLFVWQTSVLFIAYFEYKVTSRVKLVNERHSIFPAVTICNFNQYRKNALKHSYSRFKDIIEANNPLYKANAKQLDWEKYADEVKNINMENIVRSVGHQLKYDNDTKEGMLYGCVWKGRECDEKNFTTILTDLGVCYTFNSGKEAEVLKVNSPGNSFGLKLTMSVEQEQYIGHDTFSAGLKVRVHNQDEPPLVNSLGFAAMPGSHVFAAISRTKIISLKYPYETMCEDRELDNTKEYTKAACYDKCKENFIIEHCKCRAYYMKASHRLCNIKEYFECVIPKGGEFFSTPLDDCNCPEPCDIIKYNAYLSYGKFPSLASNMLYAKNETNSMDKYRRNVLVIDLFYEDLYYNILEQVPRTNLENLLGELGGLLGLYLGASVLTLAEFFDFVVSTILARLGILKPPASCLRL